MLAEDRVVLDPNDVVGVFGIMLFKIRKDVQLNSSLMMEPLLVSNDLHCYKLIGLVVVALKSLAEASLPKGLEDFVAVA